MRYDTILIDFDDTLSDFNAAMGLSIKALLSHFGREMHEGDLSLFEEINHRLWSGLEKGELTRQELLERRFAIFFAQLGLEGDGILGNRLFQEGLATYVVLTDGAEDMCRSLSQKAELYIVTNSFTLTQQKKIAASGIEKYFKGAFISEAVGFNKPDKRFFDAVFAEIGEGRRSSAIILGDSLSADMQGGINAGIDTCWFNPQRQAGGEGCTYSVSRLADFEKLLG